MMQLITTLNLLLILACHAQTYIPGSKLVNVGELRDSVTIESVFEEAVSKGTVSFAANQWQSCHEFTPLECTFSVIGNNHVATEYFLSSFYNAPYTFDETPQTMLDHCNGTYSNWSIPATAIVQFSDSSVAYTLLCTPESFPLEKTTTQFSTTTIQRTLVGIGLTNILLNMILPTIVIALILTQVFRVFSKK